MENLEELGGDLELVIGVKPHPYLEDTAQFGCDQLLYCVHVLVVVVGNTPRCVPCVHELAALALRGYSSHQKIIACREMRQSCRAPTRRAAQVESSLRRSRGVPPPPCGQTPAISSSESRPRPAPKSRGGHGAPPVTPLRNPAKPPPPRIKGGSTLRSGHLHAANNLLCRKLVAPSEKHLRVLDTRVHAYRSLQLRPPTRQQVSSAVLIARDVHGGRNTRLRPHGPCTWLKPHSHRLHERMPAAQTLPMEYVKVRSKTDITGHFGTFTFRR